MEDKISVAEANHFIMELATEVSRVPRPSLLTKLITVLSVGRSAQESSRGTAFVPAREMPATGSTKEVIRTQKMLEEAVVYADRLFQRRYYHRVFDKPEDVPDVLTALDFLCQVYSQAGPKQRSVIREHIAKNKSTLDLINYYEGMVNSAFQASGDLRWLERHLLIISIQDLRTDFRDLYATLGGIYLYMAETGIDPQSYFKKAAGLSNPKPRLLGRSRRLREISKYVGSMRDFFLKFDTSPYFVESVLPHLGNLPKKESM